MEEPRDETSVNRKMEEMKRRNEEILKRHLEIEQDKMLADQFSSTVKAQKKDNVGERKVPCTTARAQRTRVPASERHAAAVLSRKDGPPPDPNFNFLSDPSRNRANSTSEENWRNSADQNNTGSMWGQSRRHHSNYGGSDFKNVKCAMQKQRSSFKKDLAGRPSRNSDLTVQMTGRERIQYEEWKKERDRVDQERIQRQRTSDGAWRREWDSHKALEFNFKNKEAKVEDLVDNLCNALQQQRLQPGNSDASVRQVPKSELHEQQDEISRESHRSISHDDGKISVTLQNRPTQLQEERKVPTDMVKPQVKETITADLTVKAKTKRKSEGVAPKRSPHPWTFLKPQVRVAQQNTHWHPDISNLAMLFRPASRTNFQEEALEQRSTAEVQSLDAKIETHILLNKLQLEEVNNLPLFQSQTSTLNSSTHNKFQSSPKTFSAIASVKDSNEIYYSDEDTVYYSDEDAVYYSDEDTVYYSDQEANVCSDAVPTKNQEDNEWVDISDEESDSVYSKKGFTLP